MHIHPTSITTNVYLVQLNHRTIAQANFVFVHWFLLIVSWSYMIIEWLFRWFVRPSLGLVCFISCCYAVPRCSTHPNCCLLVPGLFVDPVRIPLCPCLPCSRLYRAILLVIALFVSRHCAHSTVQLIRIPSSSRFRASFLTNNTSGISCQ